MAYKGDFRASDVVDLKFSTVSTAGVPTTLSGTPAISVYKSNSTTESTTGVSLTVDFDSRTGLNHVRITTASDGTFYAAGTEFDVVITTGTVGGVSVVGIVVASFSISNRSMQVDGNQVISTTPTAGTLGEMWLMGLNRLGRRNTATAGGASTITLDAGASATDNIYATYAIKIIAGTGSGQFATIDSYVGSTKVATISRAGGNTWTTNPDNTSVFQIEAMPNVSVTGAVGSVTGAVGSVTGNVGGNIVGSVASVTGNVGGSVASVVAAVKTTYYIHKNTAVTAFPFVMTDSTTGAPSTGLTVTATRSLDGAAFSACANSATELSNGVYLITLATTDTNANTVMLRFTATGANDLLLSIITQT